MLKSDGAKKRPEKKRVSRRKRTVSKKDCKDLEFFKRVSLLVDLSDKQVEQVYCIANKVFFRKGEVIIREGEMGNSMYLFYEGQVEVLHTLTMKISRNDFEETEKSMMKLDAKYVSFFGEMALLEDAPRSAIITAYTDCTLYEISRTDFRELCENYPEIGVRILLRMSEVLCSRIRKNNRDILKLTTALSIALSH